MKTITHVHYHVCKVQATSCAHICCVPISLKGLSTHSSILRVWRTKKCGSTEYGSQGSYEYTLVTCLSSNTER
jgi:hypothetical protein